MMTDHYGYLTNLSIGGYRGSNTWENSGAYIAVGGRIQHRQKHLCS
jgi:hypothetical protein